MRPLSLLISIFRIIASGLTNHYFHGLPMLSRLESPDMVQFRCNLISALTIPSWRSFSENQANGRSSGVPSKRLVQLFLSSEVCFSLFSLPFLSLSISANIPLKSSSVTESSSTKVQNPLLLKTSASFNSSSTCFTLRSALLVSENVGII